MNTKVTINITLKDLYNFLIADCQYGYMLNDQTMPKAAYRRVMYFIPLIADSDKNFALQIVKQLCNNCIINHLNYNFERGNDNIYHNRQQAIEFIKWCLDYVHTEEGNDKYKPYSYDLYLKQLEIDKDPVYNVYEIKDDKYLLMADTLFNHAEYLEFINQNIRSEVPEDVEVKYKYTIIDNGITTLEDGSTEQLPDSFKFEVYDPIVKSFFVKHIKVALKEPN